MASHDHRDHRATRETETAFHGPDEVARVVADGEIALDLVEQVLDEVLALDRGPVRSVVDIGSGPGVATIQLARLLPDAVVLALDSSSSMTAAVHDRARAAGVADRVDTRTAEVPDGLEGLTEVDLVWASMSLHHVADEVAALRAVRGTLSPHGVVAIVEFGDQRRLLTPGNDALADRVESAYEHFFADQQRHWHGDTPSGELTDMVRAAGMTVVNDRFVSVTHKPPLDDAQRRYVTGALVRARRQLAEYLPPVDLDELERLAHDPTRADGPVVVSRRVVLAVSTPDRA